MTPESRAAYRQALLKVGFDEPQAERIVSEAEKRLASEQTGERAIPIPAAARPPSDHAFHKERRATRVVVERELALKEPARKIGLRPPTATISFLQAMHDSMRKSLDELGGFSKEEVAFILSPDLA